MDKAASAPVSHSRLLSLPPELRNHIYRYVLVQEHPVNVRYTIRTILREPTLLATNRQIRSEALCLFYAENTFHVGKESTLGMWLPCLDDERLDAINTMQLLTSGRVEELVFFFTKTNWRLALRGIIERTLRFTAKGRLRRDRLLILLATNENQDSQDIDWVMVEEFANYDCFVPRRRPPLTQRKMVFRKKGAMVEMKARGYLAWSE